MAKKVIQIELPGAHSDIGGGYKTNGVASAALMIAVKYLIAIGMPELAIPDEFRPIDVEISIHDSRKLPSMSFEQQLKSARTVIN